jgi:NADH-quinone oxidoreductase subunit J
MSEWRDQVLQMLPGSSLLVWAVVLGGLGLWFRVALLDRPTALFSRILGLLSLVLLGFWLPRFGGWAEQVTFWLLASVAVLTAGTAISTRSPVYMAIWFALSLLATSGLFLFQNAQFIGFATITVYAGAIVVTFLFVLMLAQPEGDAPYDRVSWAWFSAPLALLAGGVLLAAMLLTFSPDGPGRADASLGPVVPPSALATDQHHVARLGGELYSRHLIAVEVVGTVLLVAMVGAVAIVIQGKSAYVPGRQDGSRIRGRRDAPSASSGGAP